MATKNTNTNEDTAKNGGDAGEKEVQAAFDEATAKGYFGESPDDKPNEDYTVAGVTKNRK